MTQNTTFWSTFRILRARRWWVLLLTLVCAAAIFVGTEFQRINAIVPVESTLSITSATTPSSSLPASINPLEDQVFLVMRQRGVGIRNRDVEGHAGIAGAVGLTVMNLDGAGLAGQLGPGDLRP